MTTETAAPVAPPTAQAQASKKWYIPAFEGLRGPLVLLVLAGHAGFPHNVGWVVIPLFFVMSGFFMTTILLAAQRRHGKVAAVRAFVVNRMLRLAPLYLAFVLVLTALALAVDRPAALRGDLAWLWAWSFDLRLIGDGWSADMYSQTWSVGVEVKLLLVWVVAALLLPRRGFFWFLVACVALGPVFRVLTGLWLMDAASLDYPTMVGTLQGQFTTYLDAFATGGLLAFPAVYDRLPSTLTLTGRLAGLVLGVSLVQVVVAAGTGAPFPLWTFWGVGFPIDWGWIWGYSLIGPLSALLIVAVRRGAQPLTRVLEWAPLVWLGERSYSVYLLHLPAAFWAGRMVAGDDPPWWAPFAVFAACTPIAVGVAALTYRHIEAPFLRIKIQRSQRPTP